MRKLMICAALAAAVSAPSLGVAAPSATDAARDAAAHEAASKGRMLYICDTSEVTRRSFERAHGAMEFVTAEAAAQGQDAWAAPRCISRTEYSKLRQMASRSDR